MKGIICNFAEYAAIMEMIIGIKCRQEDSYTAVIETLSIMIEYFRKGETMGKMLKGFEKNLKLTKVEDIDIFKAMLQKEEE